MADVALERVTKTFAGGATALADVTLAAGDGELVVVVGPSGCGKSTLLRLVAGLEEPSAGTLRIAGRVVNALPPQERNVAMVFQDYALYPHLSVRGNLEFPLRMRRLGRAERAAQVERIAALLDIGALLERLPRALSGGQRQRVAMGRALVREPAVFLLDEPLSNLDPQLRLTVRAELRTLQRRTATTMLYVTHDQVEAMTLADRVAMLHGGRLQQVAPPREIYERPANVVVAGFIGNPPMRLFPARLEPAGDRLALHAGGQTFPLPCGPWPSVAPATPVTAGVRAEALRLAAPDTAAPTLRVVVEQLERLGHETLAHVRLAGDGPVRLVARLHGMPDLAAGAALALSVDPGGVHVFGADGNRLGDAE